MENISYICFCRSIFPTLTALHSHKLYCQYTQNAPGKSSNLGTMSLTTISGARIIENATGNKPDVKIKLMKSWTLFFNGEEKPQVNETRPTNVWGRRLPKRTKVPYLSRAVPLSTDHSYERCPCGAVFVTRLGKRQHQARFCKFVKNKSKKLDNSENVTEDPPASPLIRLSAAKDFLEQGHFIITEQLNNLKVESSSSNNVQETDTETGLFRKDKFV